MKKIICTMFLGLTYLSLAQNNVNAENKDRMGLLMKVENSNWQERAWAIKDILPVKAELTDIEKNKLINMFEKESKFHEEYVDNLKKQGFSVNEAYDKFDEEYRKKDYVSYFRDFAVLMSSLKDTRAIPSLLRGLNDFGGAIVPTHIIAIGEDGVEPLLGLLNLKDRTLKNTSLFVLSVWVNAPVMAEDYSINENMAIKDRARLERIKNIFLKALRDEDINVRSRAIFGLAAFPDEMVIRDLEDIAKNDPYSYYSKYEKKMKFPLREDANKTIEKIKIKLKDSSHLGASH